MKETPAAQEAFEDYYGLGPERSLVKLCEQYQEQKETDSEEVVPTTRIGTLYTWSTELNWQQRIIDRVEEDATEVRKKLQERSVKFRERIAVAIETDVTRLLVRLQETKGEQLAESAADLEKLGKLYFQLTGQPLTDKIEHGGAVGVKVIPLPIVSEDDPMNNLSKEAEDNCPVTEHEPSA